MPHSLVIILVSLCILSGAMHFAWPSPSIPKLLNGSHTLKITSNEASWLAVMSLGGSIFGGITAGPFLNRFGRLKAMLFASIPYIIAWLAIAFATHVSILFISRFMVGFVDSLVYTSVPMYIGEIADARIRGLLGSYCAVSLIIGMLLTNSLGLYLSIYTTALISISLPVLMVCNCFGLPESPYFLIMKGRHEDAIKSLKRLKQPEMVQSEFERLKQAIEAETTNKAKLIDIFRVPYYRKALIITTSLRCFQQLVGLSAITFYTETIFLEVEGAISSEVWVILFYIVKLLATIFTCLIIDKTGRKPLLYISTIGVTLNLFCVGIYSFLEDDKQVDMTNYDYIPIIALFLYNITYSVGLGPIPVLVLGELMPTNVKSYALCIVDMIFCCVGMLSSLFFQNTNDSFGLGVPFISFAFCAVLSIGFVIFIMPETKGKTLEQIQEGLKI
ncbi:facilitated trehalose transporter Tret1-like isoform X2 [Atheta coriaria]|uniref:facilitated trehalose transporter Tret1-like isoform X2 n=1 Tax=Dalotia coriaria TaxID=877792 RepID=UPI0031F4610E